MAHNVPARHVPVIHCHAPRLFQGKVLKARVFVRPLVVVDVLCLPGIIPAAHVPLALCLFVVNVALGAALLHAEPVAVDPLHDHALLHAVNGELPGLGHFVHDQVHGHVEVEVGADQELGRPAEADDVARRAHHTHGSEHHPLPIQRLVHADVIELEAVVGAPGVVVHAKGRRGLVARVEAVPDSQDVPQPRLGRPGILGVDGQGVDVLVLEGGALGREVVVVFGQVFGVGAAAGVLICRRRRLVVSRLAEDVGVVLDQQLAERLVQHAHLLADVDVPGRVGLEDEQGRDALLHLVLPEVGVGAPAADLALLERVRLAGWGQALVPDVGVDDGGEVLDIDVGQEGLDGGRVEAVVPVREVQELDRVQTQRGV